MRLEDLRWYDWLFFYFAAVWIIFIVEIFARVGLVAIFFYAMFPFTYSLYAAVPYFPIYIAYKLYKLKKGARK